MRLVSTLMPFRDAVVQFRTGGLSPRDYLEQAIEHVTQAESTLDVFAHMDLQSARNLADASVRRYRQGQALSPIDGMPVGIKDIIETADMPTQMGSDIYAAWRPVVDAACVQALRLGGAISLGKTRSTEFAIGRATTTRNPHDTERTPGGSSSGTAAGVASGMFCAGLGTQTQGSIVRPASYCGVVGYKPTWGALPLNGVHPVSASHDHLGVIAESVEAAWQVARWIAQNTPILFRRGLNDATDGELPSIPVSRLAVLRTAGYSELDGDSLASFEKQLEAWRSMGIQIVEAHEDEALAKFCVEVDQIPEASMTMVAHEMQWPYRSYVETHGNLVSEKIHNLVHQSAEIGQLQYERLLQLRASLGQQAQALGEHYDAFVLPAASGIAPMGYSNTGSRTLVVYSSFLGLPACSLPLLQVNRLPLGIQLVGSRYGDYRLLGHAQWLMAETSA